MAFEIIRTVADMRARVAAWHAQGLEVALVPTMGALHDGHLSLIRHAQGLAGKVIASIFVNPTQFGPNEDLAAYPRQEARDAELLAGAGCDLLFAPSVGEMYPQGFATTVSVTGVSDGACGDFRPGHFSGVATVVSKLLLQFQADIACFGEKDWQQLQVIRRVVRDLDIPCRIVGVPTMREKDGLAMSSRNAYLSAEERGIAPNLFRILSLMADQLAVGGDVASEADRAKQAISQAGFGPIDYLEVRDAETFQAVAKVERPARILVAAKLGRARLIDNIPVEPQ